jgi:hypothetical protein
MKRTLILVAFFAGNFLSSCMDLGQRVDGNGRIRTETRKPREAHRIKVSGEINVFMEQGSPSIKIEADENVLQYILTETNDNWLEIRTRNHVSLNTSQPVKVYISTPEITDLKVTGSGNIVGRSKFSTSQQTTFGISGSGDITLDINAPKVESHISGSGNLHIHGETKDVEVHISGSGNYDGENLKAENADVSIAGSGDARLFAENRLKASVSGSGNVRFKGNATVESHVAGSGAVSRE